MNPKRLIQYLLSASFILLIFIILGVFILPWNRVNWGTISWGPASTVTVIGEAKSQQVNQRAQFTAGVNTMNDNKQKAIDEANQKIGAIIQAVRTFGIPEADIKTQNLSVYQEEEPFTGAGSKRRLGQWRVNNSVEITIRDAREAGQLADVLSKANADSIYGPNFMPDTERTDESKLLMDAVADARKKAYVLADSAGKELGEIITIAADNALDQGVFAMDGIGAGGGGQLMPGAQTVAKTARVTFGLKSRSWTDTVKKSLMRLINNFSVGIE